MLDFLIIYTRPGKRGTVEICPDFYVRKSKDLMIRGGDFYAVWLEDRGMWSTDEDDLIQLVDNELDAYAEKNRDKFDGMARVMHLRRASTGMIDAWHKFCKQQARDFYEELDKKLIFSNTKVTKKDYASKKLDYPLEKGSIEAYDRLMSVLYSPEERRKIEWAIGAIVNGDSVKIQKFLVLYGASGTGKSTVLNIIQDLFKGYYSVFDARSLGSAAKNFALEPFRDNPLVAIQHDGDLSHIEDNTRLNSIVSHELMNMEVKNKSSYPVKFKSFLFMGTNKPVKITDGRSGLLRRLIDVSPTGNKVTVREYNKLMGQIAFELGAIAWHCKEVYEADPHYYDDYIPLNMLGASNDFFNFMEDNYFFFKDEDATTLKIAWEKYRVYCEDARVPYPFSQRVFQEELKSYFAEFKERGTMPDGTRVRKLYSGFLVEKFGEKVRYEEPEKKEQSWLIFEKQDSLFDREYADCPAQLASDKGTPLKRWDNVDTKLRDISTDELHYVQVPEQHIVIDFDIKGDDGEKSLERNLEAASKWKPTYAELSKSGEGIHLHYIYDGDVSQLSRVYGDSIEVKVFTGNSSLRRKLTECNDIPIATINSGLPMKGEKMVSFDAVKSERALRTIIKKNLNKEYHAYTKPSVDFIFSTLEEAYNSGLKYNVTDMYNAVLQFAMGSTNQRDYCVKLVAKMKFKSDDISEPGNDYGQVPLVFFDIEVFPNLLLVCWKFAGPNKKVVRMFNPSPVEIEELSKYRLVGFNCRRYDNHILYARMLGLDNEQLYKLSKNIIEGKKEAFYGEGWNFSYTDAFDFSSVKQSLKKFEIELRRETESKLARCSQLLKNGSTLEDAGKEVGMDPIIIKGYLDGTIKGLSHKESQLPWDEPAPEDRWEEVADYCENDVIATEAVFEARQADFTARCILADFTGMSVNDTTNSLTTRIVFGKERKPQGSFNYRNMGEMTPNAKDICETMDLEPGFTIFDGNKPIFPGYSYDHGVSTYRGEEVGEGGYVYAEPGMYTDVALLDIASMHPSSIVAEELFGPVYTQRFKDILDARIAIKHKDFDKAKTMLDGKITKYLTDEGTAKDLAGALKIAINSVYGLTAAKFENPFMDIRNKDNIVAKRGALFMVNLKHEVQRRGFTVAHIKTDSIKIPNATPDIIQFVMDYGKLYGYNFEHEATYEKMCLVNDAVYIAKYQGGEWTATGAQFQVPYVFKTLFSHEKIEFSDICETKQVSTAMYLDLNEDLPDVTVLEKELEKADKNDIPRIEALETQIAAGHSYHFVGKVGLFTPMLPGAGGGLLMRLNTSAKAKNRYSSVTGAKGYRWLESETVDILGLKDKADLSYYNKLVDAAAETISKYGDFEWFIS